MKVLIDIPEDYLEDIRKERQTTLWRYAIANGKALSYMTNGEIIMTLFNCMVIEISNGKVYVEHIYFPFDEEWWNAPYKNEVEK